LTKITIRIAVDFPCAASPRLLLRNWYLLNQRVLGSTRFKIEWNDLFRSYRFLSVTTRFISFLKFGDLIIIIKVLRKH